MRSEAEIKDMSYDARDAAERPKYSGMSYEDGVLETLLWVLGETDTSPLEDD